MGVKVTNHTGSRRIFLILDRATRKFHGDIGLWMQYIVFARKQKANKKVSEILTRALRLHSTKPELWVYAAKYAMEEKGDMMEARSFMQRGLRFCKKSIMLWIEYAKLELIYIAKIMGRRRILGLDQGGAGEKHTAAGGDSDDVLTLPSITAKDLSGDLVSKDNGDKDVLEKMEAGPALTGAIPVAVFDAATMHFEGNDNFAFEFFDMVANFDQLPCRAAILRHVLETLRPTLSQNPATLVRYIKQPVIGISVQLADFPVALSNALSRLTLATGQLESPGARSVLSRETINWLLPYLEEKDLDSDIQKAIKLTLRKIWKQYQTDIGLQAAGKASEVSKLLEQLEARGLTEIVEPGRAWASQMWPPLHSLVALQHVPR